MSGTPLARLQRWMQAVIVHPGSIDEALACKQSGEPKTLFFNLSGHGHFDMAAYDQYASGELEDYDYPEESIRSALEALPKIG